MEKIIENQSRENSELAIYSFLEWLREKNIYLCRMGIDSFSVISKSNKKLITEWGSGK